MTDYKNWKLAYEEPAGKIDIILMHMFAGSEEEQARHEKTEFHIWMPGKTAEKTSDLLKLSMLRGQATEAIKRSDNPLYSCLIEYSADAGLSDIAVLQEEGKILNAVSVLSSMAVPILQEMRESDPRNRDLPVSMKYGTGIEALFAAAHFRERYALPHIHILVLSPEAEFSSLYEGFIRHLSSDHATASRQGMPV